MTLEIQPNKPIVTPAEEQEQEELWTTSKFKDEFFLCSSKFPDENLFYLDRKYYLLAKESIYKIPVYKLAPTFIFNISDLTPRCREEFIQFVKYNSEKEIKLFLKQIAVKFLEAVDYDYTHISVIRHLKVGFAD
jgi:hypothetical protein